MTQPAPNDPAPSSDPHQTAPPDKQVLLECDIVMKGGITSGVVYPPAVVELAKTYRFRNVGGTSAGAIAAAATAAAELGRARALHGDGPGFSRLALLGQELGESIDTPRGKQSRLLSLFQPQPSTQDLHTVLLAMLEPGHKLWNVVRASLIARAPQAVIGLLSAVALLEWTARPAHSVFGLLFVLAFGLLAAAVAAVIAVIAQVGAVLPTNGFGLCTGREPDPNGPPALSTYLADLFDALAGQPDGKPLTFGDLEDHHIRLNVITTCLSQGKPDRLPMDEARGNRFYFDPQELRKYLPDRVVDHLLEHAQTSKTLDDLGITHLKALPVARDWPVILAVRMSLSFPVLLSAVPLHAIDFTRREKRNRVPVRCWFSDGGLSSNFPVHFFDSPIPSRPTFAFNLRPFNPDYPRSTVESENVSSPRTNRQGRDVTWRYFDQGAGWAQVARFLGAIFDTTQNWADNTLLTLPGYRERVAHVYLEPNEGGLNLVMGERTIARLGERGRFAAALLAEKFKPDGHGRIEAETVLLEEREETETESEPVTPVKGTITWDSHRFTRLHSSLGALERFLGEFSAAYRASEQDVLGLIERSGLSVAEKAFFKQELPVLVALAERWEGARESFVDKEPSPSPEMRVRPKG